MSSADPGKVSRHCVAASRAGTAAGSTGRVVHRPVVLTPARRHDSLAPFAVPAAGGVAACIRVQQPREHRCRLSHACRCSPLRGGSGDSERQSSLQLRVEPAVELPVHVAVLALRVDTDGDSDSILLDM